MKKPKRFKIKPNPDAILGRIIDLNNARTLHVDQISKIDDELIDLRVRHYLLTKGK